MCIGDADLREAGERVRQRKASLPYTKHNCNTNKSNLVWRMNLSHTQMVMVVMEVVTVVTMEQKEEEEVGR